MYVFDIFTKGQPINHVADLSFAIVGVETQRKVDDVQDCDEFVIVTVVVGLYCEEF